MITGIIYKVKKLLTPTKVDIVIGENNVIADTAKIETIYGGEIKIGNNNEILHGCLLYTYGGIIEIGSHCSINPYTIIYGHGKGTRIGSNVLIAAHTVIIPANHVFARPDILIRTQGMETKGIEIEDDVWVGAGVKILDGVTIGKGAVIAAGSVVNRNVPPYNVFAGTPAKFIKMRE